MDILRVVLTGIPLFIVLALGIHLWVGGPKLMPETPMPIVIGHVFNKLYGVILIAAVLIAAYV